MADFLIDNEDKMLMHFWVLTALLSLEISKGSVSTSELWSHLERGSLPVQE